MFTSRSKRDIATNQLGLTLLEMILFIVVLGVAAVALLTALSGPLTGAGTQTQAVTAAQVAQARMEVVLGQKRKAGYPENHADPAACGEELDPCQADGSLAFCDDAKPADWTVETQCEAFGSEPTGCSVVVVVTATHPDGGANAVGTLITNLSDSSCA